MTRRASLVVAVGAIMIGVIPVAWATVGEANYRDRFAEVSYSGSDGTLTWASTWQEIGDNNSGPSEGLVQVVGDSFCAGGRCLRARGGQLPLDTVGAARYADTSIFSDANLSYHLRSRSLGLPLVPLGGVVKVQVSTNQGGSWTTVDSWALVDLGQATTREVSINGFLSEGFGVRYLVDGLLGGEMFVDDLEIEGSLTPDPTTTTTTNPTATTTNPPTTSTSTTLHIGGGDQESSPPRNGTGAATTSTTTPTSTTTSPRTSQTTETSVVVTSDDAGLPPGTGGLRHAQHGIQAGYDQGMFGDADMIRPEVLGLTADYRMAVELVTSSWVGLVGLVLVITAALVTGLDRTKPLGISGTR